MDLILLLLIPMIIGLWAQTKVSSTYHRYSAVGNRRGLTGQQTAAHVLASSGIHDVEIIPIQGMLTDHYDPGKKRLALSEKNYFGTSLAAIGVAAHEAGHAIQDKVGYGALNLRMALVPITQFASQLLPFVVFGGLFFGITGFIHLGVMVYLILTVFQLVTLPVEFDASNRAKTVLSELGIVARDEAVGVKETLNAAAWTYVAAFIASLGNLLYLLSLARGRE